MILINIYRPPNTPQQLFEDTLNRCQEVIEEAGNNKTLLALGDFNFPFIKWPSRQIYSRDQEPGQMASEKVQGLKLLDWTETNFMEQYILTPTRKGNILDLVFANSANLIQGYTTLVNSSFSDHNILRISLNYPYKNETENIRKNPYPNMIYEYDLHNAGEEEWIRYDVLLTKLSEDYDDKTENENTNEKLERLYSLIEKAVVTVFKKKEAFKSKEEKEKENRKRNKIPRHLRIMMRKKTSISKKILLSSCATKTLRLMKALETIEKELELSYKSMKQMKEKEALSKIKRNPKYFYKYANSFSKMRSKVGPLLNRKGETVKDPFLMSEILREQYESAFSTPNPEYNIDNIGDWFFSEEINRHEREEEGDNIEREDEEEINEQGVEGGAREDELIINIQETEIIPPVISSPHLNDVHFDYMDISDAIDHGILYWKRRRLEEVEQTN